MHDLFIHLFWKTILRYQFSKVCVKKDKILRTQLDLHAEMGVRGFSSASRLALPAFLVSGFRACDFLTTIVRNFQKKFARKSV